MSMRWQSRSALVAAVLALAAGTGWADTMAWTTTSYLTAQDRSAGTFQRRGVAMFKNGDVATFTMDGRVTQMQGQTLHYTVTLEYRFEDGSTIVQQGNGRNEPTAAGIRQSGNGKLISGTGRFAGITGTTESRGRPLNETDAINEFTAEVTLPAR